MGKIIVEAPQPLANGEEREIVAGVIAVNPAKPEFGSIQMRTTDFTITGGFMRESKKIHFMAGRIEALENFVREMGLTPGCDLNQKLQLKGAPTVAIKVKESFEPSYEGQEPKINPTTGAVVTSDGKPVFRNTELVNTAEYQGDVLLETDKMEVSERITVRSQVVNDPLDRRD